MLYRPKFCSECGERIERAEWSLTTSRQHCEICATEFPYTNWVPRLSILLCGILLLVGAKSVLLPGATSDTSTARPIVSPARNENASQLRPKAVEPETKKGLSNSGATLNASNSAEKRVNSFERSEGPVFYCGAPTKKGTPCSRRVKVKGYCWQHNKPAEQ
jgi:hypothetical protein